MKLCSRCKKRVAVVFMTRLENGETLNEGLCIRCARELGIGPVNDMLSKMGITEVECKTFDPNLHNAVMHIEDESLGESEIIEVFQKGYCKGDKVIRYAMVKVAN